MDNENESAGESPDPVTGDHSLSAESTYINVGDVFPGYISGSSIPSGPPVGIVIQGGTSGSTITMSNRASINLNQTTQEYVRSLSSEEAYWRSYIDNPYPATWSPNVTFDYAESDVPIYRESRTFAREAEELAATKRRREEAVETIKAERDRWVRKVLRNPGLCGKIFQLLLRNPGDCCEVVPTGMAFSNSTFEDPYIPSIYYQLSFDLAVGNALGNLLSDEKLYPDKMHFSERIPIHKQEAVNLRYGYRQMEGFKATSMYLLGEDIRSCVGMNLGRRVCDAFLKDFTDNPEWIDGFISALDGNFLVEAPARIGATTLDPLTSPIREVLIKIVGRLLKERTSSATLSDAGKPLLITPDNEKGGEQAQLF